MSGGGRLSSGKSGTAGRNRIDDDDDDDRGYEGDGIVGDDDDYE